MVCGNNYEGLVGMLPVELISNRNCLVKIQHLKYCSRQIIGMCSPIYLAPLNHKEEPIFIIEEIHSTLHNLRKCKVTLYPLRNIRKVTVLLLSLLEKDHLLRLSLLCLILICTICKLISGLRGNII